MARDLSLKVNLQALDNATKPMRSVFVGAQGLGRALRDTQGELKGLKAQQRDVSDYRKTNIEIVKQGRALQALEGKTRLNTTVLGESRTAHEKNTANLKSARSQYNKLAQALIRGKGNTAEFRLELEKARVRLTSAEKDFGHTQKAVKTYKDRLRHATDEHALLSKKQQEAQTRLNGLKTKLTDAGIGTEKLGAKSRGLRQRVDQTNDVLSKQEQVLKRVTTQQKRLGKAKEQYERTSALAGSMAATGAGGLAAGSGILYAGAKLMAPGVQFDADMSKVQALTRLNKDDGQLAAMRAQARQLGADTMFSATDAAQGQGFLAMAGFDPQSILDAMPGMLDLAKAGDSGLAETADIASNILTGFNLKASETGRLGDVLVGAFTRSNTSLQMLGETMKYAAPVAASVGQDIETVAAMAGKLGDAGIQGSMGGTALRSILNRLSAPPAAAAKALDKLGVSAKDAQGNMRDMPSVLQEIYEKTKNMGNAERAGLLKGIAGEEAVAGMQVLVAQAGSGALQEFIGTLRETQGEAQRTAKVMGDNLVGDIDELSSAWEDLGIQLQEQQNGPLREVTQSLASVVGGVKSWIVENPKLAANIVKTAAGVGVLMAGMGGLTLAIASILGPFAMVRYGMMLFGIQGGGLATTLFNLGKTALPLVGKGILFIGRALAANPIGLAITAIAAGAYLIYRNWEPIKTFFLGLWSEIQQGVSGGLAGIGALLLNFSPLGLLYRAFAGVMSYFGVDLPSKFSEFGSNMIQGLINGFTNMFPNLTAAISGAATSVVSTFKGLLGIHSPSRVFAGLGGDTMAGLEQGLAGGESGPLSQLTSTAKRLTAAGAVGLSMAAGAMPAAAAVEFDTRAPLAAAASSGGAGGITIGGDTITIIVQGGQGQDVAQQIKRALEDHERGKLTRARSALYDQD